MDFFSFCQDGDSILNCDEGRETLKSVGIHSSFKVGEWIEKELRDHMKQNKIADALHQFLCNTSGKLCKLLKCINLGYLLIDRWC